MLISVLFSRWIFWARSGASIQYGTITAFSQKQIHLSHQTTYLYNFFTQKNIFNFTKHADQWIYQLLCYNFCHKPVQSRDRRQSTSVHCRVKLLSVYGGSVDTAPCWQQKWWQSHQFTGVIIISHCVIRTFQHTNIPWGSPTVCDVISLHCYRNKLPQLWNLLLSCISKSQTLLQ